VIRGWSGMPRYWIVNRTGLFWNQSSALSIGNGAIYRGFAGKRPCVEDVVQGLTGRVGGLGRPSTLPSRAKCPVNAPIVEEAIRLRLRSAREGLRLRRRLERSTSTGRGRLN
jgi:hypothetical protein